MALFGYSGKERVRSMRERSIGPNIAHGGKAATVCPHCGGVLAEANEGMHERIAALLRVGPMTSRKLAARLYAEPYASTLRARENVKVLIWQMRQKGFRISAEIRGRNSPGYRLEAAT